MAHTFRGASLKTWLGLEDEREAFRRYKAIRRKEREFFPAEPQLAAGDVF
jgi:anaerobic magnesium-protoporphyrin IX monomethyl ester cyclase